jgi:isocitrate/isopropylmalate dehydrogenase
MDSVKIAVIPGDGVGTEVIPEGIRALEAAGNKYDHSTMAHVFGFGIFLATSSNR